MKIDLYDIGMAVFWSCIGIAYLHNSDSQDRRTEACEQRGGHMVVVREKVFGDEKTCSLNLRPTP